MCKWYIVNSVRTTISCDNISVQNNPQGTFFSIELKHVKTPVHPPEKEFSPVLLIFLTKCILNSEVCTGVSESSFSFSFFQICFYFRWLNVVLWDSVEVSGFRLKMAYDFLNSCITFKFLMLTVLNILIMFM